MTTPTAVPATEHAHSTSAADRDHIVLSSYDLTATERNDAHRIAVQTPARAMTYLAEADAEGFDVNPRTRAKYLEAARFVVDNNLLPVYPAEPTKPEPIVTARTTTRVLPTIQTDPDGNRFLDAADGSYRFTYVERQDLPDPDFKPHVIADADPEMDEHQFQAFAADAERFAKVIKAPVASRWSAGVA